MSTKSRQRTTKRPNSCQRDTRFAKQPYKHHIPVKFVGLVMARPVKPKGQTGKKSQGLKKWVKAMLAERKASRTAPTLA